MDPLPEMQPPAIVRHPVLVPLRSEPDLRDAGCARCALHRDHPLRPKLPHLHRAIQRTRQVWEGARGDGEGRGEGEGREERYM